MNQRNIVYENDTTFVLCTAKDFEVCVKGLTHAVCVGRTNDKSKAIKTAQGMDRYPRQAKAFAGLL